MFFLFLTLFSPRRVFQQQQDNTQPNVNPTFDDLSIDDNLSQIDRLVRYIKSSIGLQRLVHAKMISDVSEEVGYETTKELIIPLLADLSIDAEPAVRQHMIEQLSPLAKVRPWILLYVLRLLPGMISCSRSIFPQIYTKIFDIASFNCV